MRSTLIRRFSERLISTVHRGTAFENRALALLTKYMSMSLTRVGGSHDGGVDLIGWWWLPDPDPDGQNLSPSPSSDPLLLDAAEPGAWDDATNWRRRRRLRVLAQCKAEKRKMGPAYLRELEGVVYRHATSAAASITDAPPPVAILVSESAFTRNCLLAAYASPLPFLLVHLPRATITTTTTTTSNSNSNSSTSASTDIPGAVFGNPALVSTRGVLGGQLEIRWERTGATPTGVQASGSGGGGDGGGGGLPGLWWQGQPLPSWTPDAETVNTAVFDQRQAL
ncbi:hypothetical protein BC827DRAFT_1122287 [Russula dissimulans]|nr:hypothetical protein BC827DRAFT_1122287 [Russula dissimulans]